MADQAILFTLPARTVVHSELVASIVRAVSVSVQVECYSGYVYAQEPRAFEWAGQRYEVERVVKRWRTPAGPAFRVEIAVHQPQTPDLNSQFPGVVDLHYVELEDRWTMTVQN